MTKVQSLLVAAWIVIGTLAALGQAPGASRGPGGDTSTIKNIISVDGVQYPFTARGIQKCIDDAKDASGGMGICDARRVPSINLGNAELDVGDGVRRVELILPVYGTWTTSITDGKSCGIKQFGKSMLMGTTTAGSAGFILAPASSTTKVFALYCTDPSPGEGGSYIRAEGIGVTNTLGATITKAAFVAQHLFDNSEFRDIYASNPSGIGVVIADACCGTTFDSLTSDGAYGATAVPLVVGDTEIGGVLHGGVEGVSLVNVSITHAGLRRNNIQIASTPFNENISFTNLYMEPNNVDATTPLIQIAPRAHNITLNGFNAAGAWAKSCTAFLVDVAKWAGPTNDVFVNGTSGCAGTPNIVDDHVTGARIRGDAAFGQAPLYVSGSIVASSIVLPGATSGSSTHVATAQGGATTITDPALSGTAALVDAPQNWRGSQTNMSLVTPTIGGGSPLHFYTTVTDSPGALTISPGSCVDRGVSLAGAGTAAVVAVAANYALEANLLVGPAQTFNGSVHYRICNVQAAEKITLNPAAVFNLAVIQ